MVWGLVIKIAKVLGWLFLSPQTSDLFNGTPTGPQSLSETLIAHQALYGEHPEMAPIPFEGGMKNNKTRWPGFPGKGQVPYTIDPALSKLEPLIKRAMEQYEKLTCIRFVKWKNQKDYVQIVKKDGCWAVPGRKGGPQELSLGEGCGYIGTIVHELGHAIGLYHEHQRSDRDTYITVYDKNRKAGTDRDFKKYSTSQEVVFTKYDYNSIMHYGNYAFSKQPGKLKTMEAKNGQKLLEPYDKPGFTNTDIDMIKKFYQCKK